jgi:hypothetical protein
LATEVDDEVDGFDWAAFFCVTQDERFALRPALQLVSDIN